MGCTGQLTLITAKKWQVSAIVLLIATLSLPARMAAAAPGDAASTQPSSRFDRVVALVAAEADEDRSAFAEAALLELASIYLAEADLARSQAAGSTRPYKLLRWSGAVERYADELLLALARVQHGAEVSVLRSPRGPTSLLVAGHAVELAHPRLRDQAGFQARVLADFCNDRQCEFRARQAASPVSLPATASTLQPVWEFSDAHGLVCSHRQLSLHFGHDGDRARQFGLCRQLLHELTTLATELDRQFMYGIEIDWGSLSLESLRDEPGHIITLNENRDWIQAPVPLLYSSPGLLADVRPWLEDLYTGRTPQSLHLQANRYWTQ